MGALSDLVVIEYAEGIAAPLCGKLLADMGATVVKVEEPARPDVTRSWGPFRPGHESPDASGLFLYLNTSKLGLALDLSAPEGGAALRDLVCRADVLLEGWTPGRMTSLGLGWSQATLLNPRLVMTSLTPFGQEGPAARESATELTAWHAGGLGYIWKERDGSGNPGLPVIAGGFPVSLQAAANAAAATMAALFARGRGGRGQHVDISMQEVLASILAGAFPIYALEGRVLGQAAQGSWIVPAGAKRCKDGEVLLSGREEVHWERLRAALGDPAWTHEEWCRDPSTRAANAELVDALMEEWRLAHTKREIVELAQAQRVPSSAICTPAEVLSDPHLAARGFFTRIESGEAGTLPYAGPPYRLSETPAAMQGVAPRLGQHSRQVLGELAGYDSARVEALMRQGVTR